MTQLVTVRTFRDERNIRISCGPRTFLRLMLFRHRVVGLAKLPL
jgi:hypothetical protein